MTQATETQTVARRLLVERRNRGLSQTQMAHEIGVTRGVYHGVERKEQVPSGKNAVAFAEFFGCQVTDLWPIDDDD